MKPKFTIAQIKSRLLKHKLDLESMVFTRLKQIGETFVTNARLNGAYADQSGNLRSSVGYVILKNGIQVFGTFPGRTAEGIAAAKKLVARLSKKHDTGFLLHGVVIM